jgi:hypothetical protein
MICSRVAVLVIGIAFSWVQAVLAISSMTLPAARSLAGLALPPVRAPMPALAMACTAAWLVRRCASSARSMSASYPGQFSRDQIPRRATDQRAMHKQQPNSHTPFVSVTPDTLASSPTVCLNPRRAGRL